MRCRATIGLFITMGSIETIRMKTLRTTYQVSFSRVFFIALKDILIFLITFLFCSVLVYIAITEDNIILEGIIAGIFVSLFFTLYAGLYPLIIYWSYYLHDKDIILTIDREKNEVLYQKKELIKNIQFENIVRLEQYYSHIKILKMQYYKIILKDSSQIVVTCLLNSTLWKKFYNVPFERIVKNYLWLLNKED